MQLSRSSSISFCGGSSSPTSSTSASLAPSSFHSSARLFLLRSRTTSFQSHRCTTSRPRSTICSRSSSTSSGGSSLPPSASSSSRARHGILNFYAGYVARGHAVRHEPVEIVAFHHTAVSGGGDRRMPPCDSWRDRERRDDVYVQAHHRRRACAHNRRTDIRFVADDARVCSYLVFEHPLLARKWFCRDVLVDRRPLDYALRAFVLCHTPQSRVFHRPLRRLYLKQDYSSRNQHERHCGEYYVEFYSVLRLGYRKFRACIPHQSANSVHLSRVGVRHYAFYYLPRAEGRS